jgi:hypothetical protein
VANAAARGLPLQQGRLPMHGANAVLWGGSMRTSLPISEVKRG